MDWASKTPFQWDWETLELFSSRENEASRSAHETNLSIEGVCSSGGGASSVLELGNWSSKSSTSTAVDSLPLPEKKKPEVNSSNSTERTLQYSNIRLARVDNCGSPPVSKADLPGEPLTGLKLGQTFSDDIGAATNIKSLSSSTSMPSSISAAKRSRVSHSNSQNFYCQVEGCYADLSAAKNYHRKHRVCENHTKSPKVIIAGQVRRFCQQCSRFHDLSEFDQTKRSCRRRLTDHNARRRKPQPATISFGSSTLSASYYAPIGHVTTTVNSALDGAYGFNLLPQLDSWIKSNKAGGVNEQVQVTMMHNTSAFRNDFDRLLSYKGISAEVLNQDLEAYVLASYNLDGAPDLQRALSLLSNNSLGPAVADPNFNFKFANMKNAGIAHPTVKAIDPTTRILQDEQRISNSTMLSFDQQNSSNQFQESQLLKTPYQASVFDSTLIQ